MSAAQQVDLGLILNDDAYSAFAEPTLEASVEHLRQTVDAYADAGVDTLCYSVAEGSDLMVYPTAVGSTWGWRPLPKYDNDPRYAERIERNRSAIEQGGDAVRTAGERAQSRGMKFIPSLRMNDPHFMADPEGSPFTGRFWVEHQDLKLGESPIVSRASYGQLLDFSHAEVREYRKAQIFEVIDRYGDLIDGFELDFNRFQVFFPPGQAWARRDLITQLVAEVRSRLDMLEQESGRPMVLIVRVAPTLRSCAWAGLDVREWMQRGIVDVVSPSQLMTMAFEMPVDEFVEAAEGTGVQIVPSILPRVVWRWPTALHDPVTSKPSRAASQDQLRATAANYRAMGADGLYLYNYRNAGRMLLDGVQDLQDPDALSTASKCFTVTKGYYLDHEDTYQNRKALPATFTRGRCTVEMYVADDLSQTAGQRPTVGLRLGLRGIPDTADINVFVNGRLIHSGLAGKWIRTLSEQKQGIVKTDDVAHQLADLTLEDFSTWRVGRNQIALELPEAVESAVLTDVELHVDYPDHP